MAERVRRHDWASTPLGPLDAWPQSLKTIVGMLLAAPNPMVLLWGPQGVLIYNDGYALFAGERHPQLLGMGAREAWPEIADFNDGNIRRGLGGEAWSLKDQELGLDRGRGLEPAWLDLDYSPVPDESGRPAGVMCFVTETTERVLADRSRQATNERLELALSAGRGVGTWDWDLAADRVVADARFADIYGVDPAVAHRGAPLSEFFKAMHPEDAVRVGEEIARTVETGAPFRSEYRLVQADGEVRWVSAEGRIVTDEDGRAVRFPGVTIDVTDRRERDAALAEAESRYSTLFNTIGSGFCIIQMKFDAAMRPVDYMIVEGNPAFEEMTGLKDAAGKWVSEIAPGLEQHWFDLYGQVALTGETARFENPADIFGRWYDVEALRIGAPEDRRVAIVFNNITERKRAEARQAALIALDDAIADLVDPVEIGFVASRILGEAMGVMRVGYGVIDAAKETIVVERDWVRDEGLSVAGVHDFRTYGDYVSDILAGAPVVVPDVEKDPRIQDPGPLMAFDIHALMDVPVSDGGTVAAQILVHSATPRDWSAEEVAFVRTFAERTRAALAQREAEHDARARQQELQSLTDGLPLLVSIVDRDHRYAFVNQAYSAWFDDAPSAFLGRHLAEVVGETAYQIALPRLERALAGERLTFEDYLPYITGGGRHMRADYVPRFTDDGSVDAVYAIVQDVSDRKRAELRQAALLQLNDALRDLTDPEEIAHTSSRILAEALEVSRVGYGVMDTVAETVTIARDYNAPGIQSIAGVIHFRDFGNYIEDLTRGETVIFADAAHDPRVEDGGAALAGIRATALINMPLMEQGKVVALLFVNNATAREWPDEDLALVRTFAERTRGVIARRNAEAAERESEARYQNLFDTMDEGFCIVELAFDETGRAVDYLFIEVNPAFERHTGLKNAQGRWMRTLAPEHEQQWFEVYGEVARTGEPRRFEQAADALGRVYEVYAFSVDDRAANRVAILFNDISARRLGEIALKELNATLEARVIERTEELTRAHEALRQSQKMEAVGQLTGGIAHDFNNLLAGISGSLELLSKRLSEGRLNGMERYIDAAQGSAQRAASLTQRLLAFSRRQTLDPKPTDVNRLINGMEDLIRRSVGPDVEVEVVGAGGLWATRIDQSQLENALLNLCINARDAMAPAGGRLTIETSNKWLDDRAAHARDLPPGQYVSLCVTDTGTGMPPEVQAQAFDPFFTTKPQGQGTGLGLSMIHGFVRQSGGQVRIYSEMGKGTTMCLYLPRHQGGVEDDEAQGLTPVAEGGHGETVLIIDDEETVRMLVAEVLGEAGYTVIEAPDGPSGLEILRSDRRIDLLISDVGLPGGMNGRQVADAARETRPDLKVLFITGYAENAAVGNGLLAPGMEVLTKPFVMGDLAAKVHDMIEG